MPRASKSLRTTKTSRAEISSIGRDPSAGSAKLMNHSNLRSVAAAFLSRRFFSSNSRERIPACFGLRGPCGLLDLGQVLAVGQGFPRGLASVPSVFQPDFRINANGEGLLSAFVAISESPAFRAVRCNP